MNLKTWADLKWGRRSALAKAIGVRPSFVIKMIAGQKKIPLTQCMPIERATNGEVTRSDLMPDTYHIHWPEYAEAQQKRAQAAPETVATAGVVADDTRLKPWNAT
jgi:DNA-binding transcriptional regulator YdaS (Cro superfamily)